MNARTLLLTFGLACIAAATPSVDSLAPDATDEMREALETAPPEAIYNAGVQMFRAGNFEAARDLFSTAASRGKESVAARSMYNLGTSGYADALKLLQPAEGGGVGSPPTDTSSDGAPVDPRDQAISALEDALRELKDAMRADPKNIDARANAEMAHRLLKSLKEEQKNDEKKDEKNDEKNDEKEDEKKDEKNDGKQDGDGKPSDEQKQQEKKQQEKKNKDDSKGEKDDKKQDEKKDEKPSDDKTPPTEEAKQDQAKGEQKPMSKQEVERVLQKIRDRERERIQAKLQRERARTLPAPKDW